MVGDGGRKRLVGDGSIEGEGWRMIIMIVTEEREIMPERGMVIPCGRPPAESSGLPQRQSRWPGHHTGQRCLMGPCGTYTHKVEKSGGVEFQETFHHLLKTEGLVLMKTQHKSWIRSEV